MFSDERLFFYSLVEKTTQKNSCFPLAAGRSLCGVTLRVFGGSSCVQTAADLTAEPLKCQIQRERDSRLFKCLMVKGSQI